MVAFIESGFGSDVFIDVLSQEEIAGGVIGIIFLPPISLGAVQQSSAQVVVPLGIPPDPSSRKAVVTVTAAAPGTTNVGGIATVRAAAGEPTATSSQLVIDFGALRTVSALEVPSTAGSLNTITPWVGTKFDGGFEGNGFLAATFNELQTERLLVGVANAIAPSALADGGKVTTTTPPADLELLVAGTRVFFRPGPAPPGFSQDVDVTAAVQAAVDAGGTVGADGNLTVPLTLQARVPGTLGLAFADTVRFLRTFTVDFPGPTTSARSPRRATRWSRCRSPPTPARGRSTASSPPSPPTTPARCACSRPWDRRRARTPSCCSAPTAVSWSSCRRAHSAGSRRLSGVRVLLTAGASGIEIGGALLGGTATTPGDPLPKATMAPVSLPASSSPAWATLSLARPFTPPPGVTLWLSLAVNRGSAVMALADLADDRCRRRVRGAPDRPERHLAPVVGPGSPAGEPGFGTGARRRRRARRSVSSARHPTRRRSTSPSSTSTAVAPRPTPQPVRSCSRSPRRDHARRSPCGRRRPQRRP